MKKFLLILAASAAVATIAPVASIAQVEIDTPAGGVRVGEPHYRDYDRGDRVERRSWREREVRSGRGCRTVTIERDDGSMKRIRRCD
jgi:hypothetical protein